MEQRMTARRARRAFTLVELLVVIGIIAALISILMPALTRARDQAMRTKCMNNVRQLLIGCQRYGNDYKYAWPFCNWLSQEVGPNPYAGWMYKYPKMTVQEDVQGSVLWPYLKNEEIYHCPLDPPPYKGIATHNLSSFLMNGAANGFGRVTPKNQPVFYKITKFKNDAIALWEAPDYETWNDGSSFPDQEQTRRHGKGASIGCFGGHVEWMLQKDLTKELQKAPGRLWCVPDTPKGA
jgi:prepilin-type N-terminal cleavage/methylation domain-containing protein